MKPVHRFVAMALGVLLALSLVPASHAQAQGDSRRAEHDRVVAFWTKDKVAKAKGRDFVLDPKTKRFKPSAKPGGGGSTQTVLGASWTSGGAVVQTTGKVLFALGSSYYVCSASVVDDGKNNDDRSIILTAGHCVYDETNQQWATNWMFIPDYDAKPASLTTSGSFCAETLYGCWVADFLVASSKFTTAGGFNQQATVHDYAFAVVSEGVGPSGNAQLDGTVGTQPMKTDTRTLKAETYLFGYPAAGKYNGKDLVYSRGPLGTDPYNDNLTYRVSSDMTGGCSGGPWFQGFSGGSGTLMSVNSYGYSGIKAMHGPQLNSETESMFKDAGTKSLDGGNITS